ncbi:type VII secretion protein EccCa [Gordonia sp. TBRC 11910]|uniref:Type VII secretion protein EccCa n=1 Tax=Gordonia asplenii TaxID=2725283 RepID=A0A848KU01_9ACTN|nr:type VII secretion protein EccCa [Gordonia asplenii]NMO02394.1 type VII secretion protein EccCa [Gordonia asplenii]
MATQGYVRRPRVAVPRAPAGEVNVAAPPDVPRAVPGNALLKLLPAVMVIAVVGMIALMFVTGGRNLLSNPLFLMFPMMMLMSMFGMFAGNRSGAKPAAELNEDRKDYFRYLGQLRADVRDTKRAQRANLTWAHPDPRALVEVIGSRRMWERTDADPDFGHVRIGVGSQRLATRLNPPETGPPEDLEPVSMVALRRFVRTHSVVHRLPTAVSLRGFATIGIAGARSQARELVRAMLIELCTFHAPDVLRVAIVTRDPLAECWDWAKWLPHVGHPSRRDALGSERMIWHGLAELEDALADELNVRSRFSRSAPVHTTPHLVVVLDDGYVGGHERLINDAGTDGVTVIDLADPDVGPTVRRGIQLVLRHNRIAARSASGLEEFADADALSIADAEALARKLARFHLARTNALIDLDADPVDVIPDLLDLLGIADAGTYAPEAFWRGRSAKDRLRVPIGCTPEGAPIELDIKESAEGGMGPHGLCIGATGSGKSEFLRTLVVALITTHAPTELNLVLVDFKGGATFLGLDAAPHVAAVITNLEQELEMVDRMRDALSGEMNRRQEVLRAAGNFANVGEYERARAAGAALPPLPALFIVVDEFSELLSQKPDFAELFVAIGRLGRSLHIHLLLASQRLEEGKLRGLDSHLSYRIGLKTFSAHESRSVLGVPDAYHLPSDPGSAYLKSDSAQLQRFKAGYVSGPYVPQRAAAQTPAGLPSALRERVEILTFTALPVTSARGTESSAQVGRLASGTTDSGRLEQPSAPAQNRPVGPSILETLVGAMIGRGAAAHQVWLPPLDEPPTLDQLGVRPGSIATGVASLRVVLGVVDRPYDQRRDPLLVDLSGAAGNVAVVGGPQAGKSVAIRSLMMSAAATHSPDQIQFYCLDFGGGTLASLAGLPHVGSVASRTDSDAVRRTVAELTTVMRDREQRFAAHGIESMRDYRARRAAGATETADDPFGDVFLVFDGVGVLRNEWEVLDDAVASIAAEGLSYGVHVIVTASRWAEIRPAMKDMLGTRIELKLGDAMDSEISRRAALLVPANRPGRGITGGELHTLTALPRFDADPDVTELGSGIAAGVRALRDLYGDARAPRIRMLGNNVDAAALDQAVRDSRMVLGPNRVAIGIGESALQPVVLDFTTQPHFVAFADVEHGKTTLLRTIATGLVANATAAQVKLVIIDYRRTMLGLIDGDHVAGYASAAGSASAMLGELAAICTSRLPADDVTPAQLRERSWWNGPDVYVLVDDYDMVATAVENPLLALLDLLAHARDIGLHLIVARRSGGVSRALYDPIIARLRDLSTDTLLMSGDRDEGYIVGQSRMQRLVPGRGELISRTRQPEMVQIARTPAEDDSP